MLISIITPVKNGAQYLEEMLQSIHVQSYPFIEHIVVDGGSTDGSLEIIQSFDCKYPNR
ncbi:MAG: glycosyltransferase, partial [Candidatus Heimdallarchaeota archaeon]|nr:glycosyltransferase [Candidatus Heimdallarchaeota archaeon]